MKANGKDTSNQGRRRNEKSHQAILKAAAELLEEKGYRGICIEAIANRAGVGKQTIYRWWTSKAAVVMEAYAVQASHNVPTPDTGDLRKDLYQILQQLFTILNTTSARDAMTGLIAEAQLDTSVAESFREQFVATRRAATQTIIERAIERQELRNNLDIELVIDAIYGAVWYRLLLKHAPIDDTFAEELINLIIVGIKN
jgi:AcrR family transcriptional regulator